MVYLGGRGIKNCGSVKQMFTTAFSLAVICTVLICLGILLIKWIIFQVGAVIFAVILLVMCLVLLLAMENKHYGE